MGDASAVRTATVAIRPRGTFFIWIAIAMLAAVALGFGKSFYLRPVFHDRSLPAYLVVHGAIMTAWYLLFLAQAVLAYRGRVDLHRRLGAAGAALAIAVVVTAINLNLERIPRTQALGYIATADELSYHIGFALDSLGSLVPFVVLVALAVAFRRKAAIHKRLMYWAMVWTIGPAFTGTRPLGQALDALVAPHLPFFPSDLAWLAALLAYDWRTQRRFHPATYVPFALLAIWFFVVTGWIVDSATLQDWLRTYVLARM